MSKPSTRPGTNRKHHISSSCPFHQHVSMLCSLCHLWHPLYITMLSKKHICDHDDNRYDIYCNGWSIGKPSYMWSWGYIIDIYIYIYEWWSIGKHQWSWSHIWYLNDSQCLHMELSPNRAIMYYPTSSRHGWAEGPGHLTTRTESPAPAARSPRSQPLGSCWLICFAFFFFTQQPWLMVDDECSTMVVDDIWYFN